LFKDVGVIAIGAKNKGDRESEYECDRQFSPNRDRTLHFNCGGDRQFSANSDRHHLLGAWQ